MSMLLRYMRLFSVVGLLAAFPVESAPAKSSQGAGHSAHSSGHVSAHSSGHASRGGHVSSGHAYAAHGSWAGAHTARSSPATAGGHPSRGWPATAGVHPSPGHVANAQAWHGTAGHARGPVHVQNGTWTTHRSSVPDHALAGSWGRNDWSHGHDSWHHGHDSWHHGHGFRAAVVLPFWYPSWYSYYPGYYGYGSYDYGYPNYYDYSAAYPPAGTDYATYAPSTYSYNVYQAASPPEVPVAPADVAASASEPSGGAYYADALAAFRTGDYQQAARLANHAIVDVPRDARAHQLLTLGLFALGDYRGAAVEAHAAAELGPAGDQQSPRAIYSDPSAYTRQLTALEQFVRANPSAADAQFLLAYQYLTNGRAEDAKRLLRDIAAKMPWDRTAARLLEQVGGGGSRADL